MDYDFICNDDQFLSDDPDIKNKMQDIIQNIENLKIEYLNLINKESLEDITQQQYNGFLIHCSMFYFKPTKCLYKHYPGISNNGKTVLMFNDSLLYILCEYYISMSYQYNKVVNTHGFSLFIGTDTDTIARWSKLENQRPVVYRISKRLQNEYEKSLENGAQSGKNPVGFIATLNHRFGWSADSKPSLTVNITRSRDEIMQAINPALLTEISETQ